LGLYPHAGVGQEWQSRSSPRWSSIHRPVHRSRNTLLPRADLRTVLRKAIVTVQDHATLQPSESNRVERLDGEGYQATPEKSGRNRRLHLKPISAGEEP